MIHADVWSPGYPFALFSIHLWAPGTAMLAGAWGTFRRPGMGLGRGQEGLSGGSLLKAEASHQREGCPILSFLTKEAGGVQ